MSKLLKSTEAAEVLGVTPSTVKRWADEGLLPHVKTAGGHRRFRKADLHRFSQDDSSFAVTWADKLLRAGNPYYLRSELLGLRAQRDSWCEVADDLGSALVEIGQRWANGGLSIHEEHMATENLRRALASCADAMPLARDARNCVLVVAEGDEHTLGLSMLEPCLREFGWNTPWLGRKTPLTALTRYIQSTQPKGVAISASAFSQSPDRLEKIAHEVSQVCDSVSSTLLFGGAGEWPQKLPYGHRIHHFKELQSLSI